MAKAFAQPSLFDLLLIFFFNFGIFCCPCSLKCIHVCISFRRLNDDVDVSLGNNQSHERNQKPVCGRKQHAEVDETHSLSISNRFDARGPMWGVAAHDLDEMDAVQAAQVAAHVFFTLFETKVVEQIGESAEPEEGEWSGLVNGFRFVIERDGDGDLVVDFSDVSSQTLGDA